MKKTLSLLILISVLSTICDSQEWFTDRGDYKRRGAATPQTAYNLSRIGLLWACNTSGPIRSSPAVSDINGDGKPEIIFGSDDHKVYALRRDGEKLWTFETGGPVRSSPTIADVNQDGKKEIIIGSDDKNLYLLDAKGRPIWGYATSGMVRGLAASKDLGGTEEQEIIFGSADKNLYFLSPEGVLLYSYKTADSIISSPTLYDIDYDINPEVIFGSQDNVVHIIKYPPHKSWGYQTSGDIAESIPIKNNTQMYAASQDGKVYSIRMGYIGTSETRRIKTATGWTTQTLGLTGLTSDANYSATKPITTPPAVAEVCPGQGEGPIFGSNDKTLYALSWNMTRCMRYTTTKAIESSPAVSDLDLDGIPEIIFGSNEGKVYLLNYPGKTIFTYQTNGPVKGSPALADLNSDGTIAFLIGSDDGTLYAFGDTIGYQNSDAASLLKIAKTKGSFGDLDGADQTVQNALKIYESNEDQDGQVLAQRMLEWIKGKRYLKQAKYNMENGTLFAASDSAKKAVKSFTLSQENESVDEAQRLSDKIEADRYLSEAKYFIDNGYPENATAYLGAAQRYYSLANETMLEQNVRDMIKNLDSNETINKYILSASEYLEKGNHVEAKRYLNLAANLSKTQNNTELKNRANALLQQIRERNQEEANKSKTTPTTLPDTEPISQQPKQTRDYAIPAILAFITVLVIAAIYIKVKQTR